MKILINLIGLKGVAGQEVFVANIFSELIKNISNNISLEIFKNKNFDLNLPENFNKNIRINEIKNNNKIFNIFYVQFILPFKAISKDILFSPTPSFPILCGKKNVVIIHDCAYKRFPEEAGFFARLYVKIMYFFAARGAKKIFTVSSFSKQELMNLYNIKESKIIVVSEGIPEMPSVGDDFINQTLVKFNINQPYFLYIGSWRPRKNILRLIQAFRLFLRKNPDYLLVLGGGKDTRFINLEEEIKKNNLEENVVLTDFISQEEKVALYKRAQAFLFPSLYEGFGLPVLEAQSLGVPLLTSNISSLPEVAGDGALFVDPYNIESIAEGMEKIAFDEQLRNDLIKKGRDNCKRFSWEKSAQKILDIFQNFYENTSGK